MLAIDKDEIEVELPQNVDHPWGWEGKPYALRPARMAALTRLDCFIVCPHACGDCDLIVPCCRCLARW
jgi:hypothetical protein